MGGGGGDSVPTGSHVWDPIAAGNLDGVDPICARNLERWVCHISRKPRGGGGGDSISAGNLDGGDPISAETLDGGEGIPYLQEI